MKKHTDKKTKLFIALLFLPAILLVVFAVSDVFKEITLNDITKVQVTLPTGTINEYTEKNDIDFYVDMAQTAEKVESSWRDLESETPTKLLYIGKDGKTREFSFYPERNESGCFITDENGVYRVNEECAASLILRAEYEYLYSASFLPLLCVESDGAKTQVKPQDYSWLYKKSDERYYYDTHTEKYVEGDTVSFKARAVSKITFRTAPDELNISYYDENGMAVTVSELADLIYPEDTLLTVEATAVWNRKSDCESYGTARWRFKMLYDIPVTVNVSTESLKQGEIGYISFEHLNDASSVTLETELQTSKLKVNEYNGKKFAFLPIAAENSAGSYTLKINADGIEHYAHIVVGSSDYGFARLTVNAEKYNDAKSPIGEKEVLEFRQKLESKYSATPFFTVTGTFKAPVTKDASIKYGTEILTNNIPPNANCFGNIYELEAGSAVVVAEHGKVVFVGETALYGKTVVVDHGFGVQTHYYYLQTAAKSEGVSVQKGEVIASSGDTGMIDKASLGFAVTVDGVYVDPAVFFANGVAMPR